MSRKREREEDQHLTEPRKKAKTSKDKKKDKKRLKQKDLNLDAGSPVFDVTELVENILKYLILRPETVLSIAKVSRRHNAIVHGKSFWTRLGFTEKLSKTDVIEPQILKKLLIGLRRDHVTKKYASQTALLGKNSEKTNPWIGETVDLSIADQVFLDRSLEDFLSQRTYTGEAYLTLERLRKNTKASTYLEVDEFFDMVLISEAEIPSKTDIVNFAEHDIRYTKYPGHDNVFEGYYKLLDVFNTDSYEQSFSIKKKFIDEDKSVVFLIDNSFFRKIHFISVNQKTRTIECCGDLIRSALDPHNWTEDLVFDKINDDVMYNISFFLSRFVFQLEEVDENLAAQEFDAMATHLTSKNILVSWQVPQYYWENIPLYRK